MRMLKSREFHSKAVWPNAVVIFSIFGHLEQGNFANSIKYLHKVGSQFCKILNSYSRNGLKLSKCCPSGEISPNLVRLFEGEPHQRTLLRSSVTRLGDFKKFLGTNLLTQVAQKLAVLKMIAFEVKTAVATLWVTFDFLATFDPTSGRTATKPF